MVDSQPPEPREINVYHLSPPVYGLLLRQPELTKTNLKLGMSQTEHTDYSAYPNLSSFQCALCHYIPPPPHSITFKI